MEELELHKLYSNDNLNSAQRALQGIQLRLEKFQVILAVGLADNTVLAANGLSNLYNILFLTQNYCLKYGVSLCHENMKLLMIVKKSDITARCIMHNHINIDEQAC